MIAVSIDAGPTARTKKKYRLKDEIDVRISDGAPEDTSKKALVLVSRIGRVEGLLDALAFMHCIDASFSITIANGLATAHGTIVVSSNDAYFGVKSLIAVVENETTGIATDYPEVTFALTVDMTAEKI